jgi:DNA-binding NarL/FixJ family response regulator/anti-sigma regulatory factor (Ser/Thr protein kinase)
VACRNTATSRETLAGLRRLLGGLRQVDLEAGAGDPVAPVRAALDPAPGLADLDRLVAKTKDAGVRVDVRRRGARRALPCDLDLSAYRIVQEAVTNVVRHSGTRDCSVTVDYGERELSIEVVDLGCATAGGARTGQGPGLGGGFGIVGMRERVSLLHGEFSAGARTGGGFRVAARLPVPAAVGAAGDGAEAYRLVRRERPDVAVMDVRMPGTDGIEGTRRITGDPESATRVLVLTTFDDDEYVYGALRAGASGFLLKDMELESILDGIRVVAAGEGLIAPSVTRRLIEEFAGRPAPAAAARSAAGLEGVTEREREVLTLIGRGLSNTEIAGELCISVATAKSHVGRLFSKLGARDRVQLVILGYETGLVGPSR